MFNFEEDETFTDFFFFKKKHHLIYLSVFVLGSIFHVSIIDPDEVAASENPW